MGLKTLDVCYSLMYFSRSKLGRPIALIRPNSSLLLKYLISQVKTHQIQDLYQAAAIVNVIEKVYWLTLFEKDGCRFCNKNAPVYDIPSVFDALRHTRIGSKFRFEEDLVADRVLDLMSLDTNKSKIFDLVIPRRMVSGVMQSISKMGPRHAETIKTSEYINRFAKSLDIQIPEETYKSSNSLQIVGMLAAVLSKNKLDIEHELRNFSSEKKFQESFNESLKTLSQTSFVNSSIAVQARQKNCIAAKGIFIEPKETAQASR